MNAMNPAVKQASECLALALASGEVKSDDLLLTETQQALKIPKPLVYLCGLVVVASRQDRSFTKEQTAFFHRLQKIYSDDKETRLYRPSPNLLPGKDAKALIHADLCQKLRELTDTSRTAADQLWQEEERRAPKLSKKVWKSKSVLLRGKSSEADDEREYSDSEANGETLEELMEPTFAIIDEEEILSSDWTEVKRRRDKQTERRSASDKLDLARNEEHDEATAAIKNKGQPRIHVPGPEQIDHTRPSLDADNGCSTKKEELSALNARIRQLESEIIAKDELLRMERASHKKVLKELQEGATERMQALQLRLHVSETRLQAFEDAFEEHVNAVASNTASGSSPMKRGLMRDGNPRFSRVLGKRETS